MNVTLKVYEDDMVTVKKECKANMIKVPFGIIRKLMKLFNVENAENTTDILGVVTESWDQVISLLNRIFPDITEEDWDTVDIKELVAAIYKVLKFTFTELISIPTDPKN